MGRARYGSFKQAKSRIVKKREIFVVIFNLKGIVMADGPEIGVCDASCETHHLHDVFNFLEHR